MCGALRVCQQSLLATPAHLFSCRLALNSRCTAWSFRSLLPARYSLMTLPVQVLIRSGKFHSCAGTCVHTQQQVVVLLRGPLLQCRHSQVFKCLTPCCCRASTSFLACVLLPLRSTPSNRMKAPRPAACWPAILLLLLLLALEATERYLAAL